MTEALPIGVLPVPVQVLQNLREIVPILLGVDPLEGLPPEEVQALLQLAAKGPGTKAAITAWAAVPGAANWQMQVRELLHKAMRLAQTHFQRGRQPIERIAGFSIFQCDAAQCECAGFNNTYWPYERAPEAFDLVLACQQPWCTGLARYCGQSNLEALATRGVRLRSIS